MYIYCMDCVCCQFFFFKQKTAYEMRISDWSSDVCSSDLMIVTFESLGDMTLFSQSGGIAAGISTALFTTQMGLVVAVPGVIAKSVLDRRQHQIGKASCRERVSQYV